MGGGVAAWALHLLGGLGPEHVNTASEACSGLPLRTRACQSQGLQVGHPLLTHLFMSKPPKEPTPLSVSVDGQLT